jgi:hypothetical protein
MHLPEGEQDFAVDELEVHGGGSKGFTMLETNHGAGSHEFNFGFVTKAEWAPKSVSPK